MARIRPMPGAAAMLLAPALLAGSPVDAASPEHQKQALETIAAVLAGRREAAAARPFFARNAVFAGASRDPWDIEKFRASLVAGGCGTRSKYWDQDSVLSGIDPDSAAQLCRNGHPEGPGLSFYCASPKIRAGHSMITFKFDGGKITQVRQAYYVPVPDFSPPQAESRSN
jgi:hypothetical protein